MTNVSRRVFLGSAAVAAGELMPTASMGVTREGLQVARLRTAQLVDPLGLNDPAPSLSWQIASGRRGVRQAAYRIRVARSRSALRAGKADLWDSGRVSSAISTGIPYAGPPLASRTRAWWTVTVWDEEGTVSHAPEPAWWETALCNAADWSALWLAAESADDRADRESGMPSVVAPVAPSGGPRLFRLPFFTDIDGEVGLTLFSSGFLENVTLDGVKLAMPPHPYIAFGSPAASSFTLPLAPGPHMLAAQVTPPRGFVPAKEVSVAALIRIPQADGSVQRVNQGWQTSLAVPEGWRLAGSPDANWLPPAVQEPQPHPAWPAGPAVMMRHGFAVGRRPARARLYVAALGACEMRINGRSVSPDRLQSESSDFRKTILYRSYDVTDLVRKGDNVLAALIGDGWYASYMAPAGRYPFGPAPRRLIAQLEIDGVVAAQTGPGWRMHSSPILHSELYDGESYDARREQSGWDVPGFDDTDWRDCWTADSPQGKLVSQTSPAVRITRTIRPVATTRLAAGRTVVDFGQNFAGLARLTIKGAAGSTVTMRFAEILKDDGSVDQTNLRGAKATDRYILRGDPTGETYLPHFTFHGFRYVQIDGLPDSGWAIDGQVMGSDLPEAGTFRISDPTLQKLWLNTLWSQRSNFLAIPTDCPQRDERLGWSGDAQIFWDAAAYNMDVGPFTRRFLGDLRDGQTAKGAFPIYAPIVEAPVGASPGWADAGVMLPWICWRHYGDTAMITEHWGAMSRYVDGVIKDNPDMIWRKVMGPNFGDWLSLDARGRNDETTPNDLVATAMLKRSLDQIADMGQAIGKEAEADRYRGLSERTTQAFRAAFVKADGTVGNGSHTSYILAIALRLLTPAQNKAAGDKLAADIRRRGTLLSTGFLGTPLSLDAIAASGNTSLVYDLLLRTDFPSWGYMVRKGATTIWERWNGDTGDVAMNSYNHYALGAVIGFFYRRIAGIEEMEPGFGKVRIAPLIDPRLRNAAAVYDSVRGRISVNWSYEPGRAFTLDVTIPANVEASIHLPTAARGTITESGARLTGRQGIRRFDEAQGEIDIGSGTYAFSVA